MSATDTQPIEPVIAVPGRSREQADRSGPAPTLFDVEDTLELSPALPTDEPRHPINTHELPEKDQARLEDLKQRDQQIRAHEQAHLATAGPYAIGGAAFEYQTGPDGKRYAVAGEVQIDTGPVAGDPEATIRKMEQVLSAALAPANPSAQDRAVAARAAAVILEARAELAEQAGAADGSDERASTAHAQRAAGSPEAPTEHLSGERYRSPALIDVYA